MMTESTTDARPAMQTLHSADALIATWLRHDWRESFFAPGLSILQALTRDGRTASGAGMDREEALNRCLGETAEILALNMLSRDRSGGQSRPFDPRCDGLAAHPDPHIARQAALNEACERFAVAKWWLGHSRVHAMPPLWLDSCGLTAELQQMRDGAALRRRTDWWQIDMHQGPITMICRSMSVEGQDPLLGFGTHADPVAAAGKALRELLLMELNLMELLAARSTGGVPALRPVNDRIRDYTRRLPMLLRSSMPDPPGRESVNTFPPRPECREITGAGAPLSVWLCQPDVAPPPFTAETGSPYF
ncbi:YcaO-like family protein [Paracoccus sp. SMMA_5]|nr:YcaO-like family protein [Paracoccus sp. SMMA_5]UXU76552.1 YcaO-like family protein [Paracoccus sp. SMMA_5]